jgi:hypothetical protein
MAHDRGAKHIALFAIAASTTARIKDPIYCVYIEYSHLFTVVIHIVMEPSFVRVDLSAQTAAIHFRAGFSSECSSSAVL